MIELDGHSLTLNALVEIADRSARVAISARLMRDGRVAAARVFESSVPIASLEASSAVAGLNQAFGEIVRQLVAWTAVNRPAPAAAKEGSAQ